MFKLTESTSRNLPGPALRDVTPKRLGGAKVGAGGTAAKSPPKLAPAHLGSDDEAWEEF
jgi:hypothetical protein